MAAFTPHSTVPVIGASGAIAGVLGAYFVLYPRARITTVLPIFVLMYFVEIPAVVYLLLWFVAQLYAGLSKNPRSPEASHGGRMSAVSCSGWLLGPDARWSGTAGRRSKAE